MKQTTPFPTGHSELIHDVEYDFYGKQLATCSSDQHIKVFDLDPTTQEWILNDSWKAHDSSIVKIAFASPQFGHILVSVSYDRTLKVWEENFDEQVGSQRRWKKLATISDSRYPLYDVAFAPSHLGLRVGTIGSDGILRIYDALEPSDLRNWTMTAELQMLQAPSDQNVPSDFCLTWSPSRFSSEKILVTVSKAAYILGRDKNDKYIPTLELPDHGGLIRSVAWAPSMGRSYQLVATGCQDGVLRVFKLIENQNKGSAIDLDDINDNAADGVNSQDESLPNLTIQSISTYEDHKIDGKPQEIWKVSWNLTGTILSSAGQDGKIRLWKSAYNENFQCMSVINAESNQ
ncbi:hypothetical protein B5S33_g745 [[Candida] boidinii]|nr:hypothetical protein B5S33_g745 [[Candida] boidinii]